MSAIGHIGALGAACGINLVARARRVVAPGIHIELQILGTLMRQREVEQHRLLAHLAFEIIPPIILLRIGQVVGPDIEVSTQESLIWRLAHILLQGVGRDALLARNALVILDFHTLQEVLALGELARDVTRRA